jgi:hypothetical protein
MKDDRLYMRFPIEFPDDPKIAPMSTEAKWALVEMVAYSRRQNLDGVIPRKYAEHRWGDVLDELLEADAESPFLTYDEVYGYTLTKYDKHQFTSNDLAQLRERKSQAGRKGAAKRWHGDDSAIAAAMADASQSDDRAHGKKWPESESESELELETSLTDVTNSVGQSPTQSADSLTDDQVRLVTKAKEHALALGVADLPAIREYFESKLGLAFNLGQAAELCDWVLGKSKAGSSNVGNPTGYIRDAVRKSAPEWRDRAKQLGCEVAA